MTTQDIVILAASIAVAVLALAGALVARRTLGRAGAGLQKASGRLDERAQTIPDRVSDVRAQLSNVDAQVEHALWMLGNFDDRSVALSADLRAKRVASDSLRLRLIQGRLTVARIRQLMKLLVRLGELRRAIL